MGYMCFYHNKECDKCDECNRDDNDIFCNNCECLIKEGELYFEIDNSIFCKECTEYIYGKYN